MKINNRTKIRHLVKYCLHAKFTILKHNILRVFCRKTDNESRLLILTFHFTYNFQRLFVTAQLSVNSCCVFVIWWKNRLFQILKFKEEKKVKHYFDFETSWQLRLIANTLSLPFLIQNKIKVRYQLKERERRMKL